MEYVKIYPALAIASEVRDVESSIRALVHRINKIKKIKKHTMAVYSRFLIIYF
jgi:hypothetical protein